MINLRKKDGLKIRLLTWTEILVELQDMRRYRSLRRLRLTSSNASGNIRSVPVESIFWNLKLYVKTASDRPIHVFV